MSRVALVALFTLVAAGVEARTTGRNPHADPSIVLEGCTACHAGHGASRSPMLVQNQRDLCLDCHGEGSRRADLAPDAAPPAVASAFAKVSSHPITRGAYSKFEGHVVVCTSCHSPHRASDDQRTSRGRKRHAPNDPLRFEYELCESCHDHTARIDIASLIEPANRSSHPLKAPATGRSPSTLAEFSGTEINCTDCHGNDEAAGPRGPHGSNIPHLLRRGYRTSDGSEESKKAFELCYSCHDRQAVLQRSPFPQHGEHIDAMKISCATCHDAHGSITNRALIRFGSSQPGGGTVLPSARTGRIAYVSDGPGSGACYLNCHGHEHSPEAYGSMKLQLDSIVSPPSSPAGPLFDGTSPLPSDRGREHDPGTPQRREKP